MRDGKPRRPQERHMLRSDAERTLKNAHRRGAESAEPDTAKSFTTESTETDTAKSVHHREHRGENTYRRGAERTKDADDAVRSTQTG